jgi:RNA polymerase sigma-70 factor (ECF subfamily)
MIDGVVAETTAADAAFVAFYDRERDPLVRALTLTLGEPELANEAVDEAMARAYARWRGVGRYDNPGGWVYRVALNWARSRVRRRRFMSRALVPERAVRDPEPVDAALWEAIAKLPFQQRSAIILRFGLDWPLDRIADAVGAPVGTVKSRLSRGVASLRSTLGVDA